MKIITIIGARPQFIKAATVSRVIKENASLTEVIVHTGQHYDANMSKVFFEELTIPQPDYNLGIGGGNHGHQTGKMLDSIEKVLLKEKPDKVIVYGDTNSTLAGALAAVKLHIPVAHVEAGLRSFNKRMPEEINRILTDHTSDFLFAPTITAVNNLKAEGIPMSKVFLTGDVMYDAAIYYGKLAEGKSRVLQRLHLEPRQYNLATIHRAENTNDKDRLKDIFSGLEDAAKELEIVLPLHPRTKMSLQESAWNIKDSKIHFIEPVGYLDMVTLEKNARVIVTDSGGVQKEAYFHQVPCVTLRSETEWVELLEYGYNVLVKEFSQIGKQIHTMGSKKYNWLSNFYGDGSASRAIIEKLITV